MTATQPLSQVDAFFVAYQERSGILMQLGGEVHLRGLLHRADLEQMLSHIMQRWPQLGQTLQQRVLGLAWSGTPRTEAMVHHAADCSALHGWRNQPIDPFHEPPFQVLWIPEGDVHLLAFRAHHAVTDGQAFITVCTEALHALASVRGGTPLPRPETAPLHHPLALAPPMPLLRQGKLGAMWRYTRWMAKEAKANRSARVAMQECAPGDMAICERVLDHDALEHLNHQANASGLTPFWLCAAAWIQAIHAWNTSREAAPRPLISLEVPVSLRRGKRGKESIGNLISPLVLFGDAAQSRNDLARSLKKQFLDGVRDRAYLGMPVFTAMGRFLPWALFRRIAVTSTSTGFATSHYTWLSPEHDLFSDVATCSKGTLDLLTIQLYTPVCLHMGAALTVLAYEDHAHLFITHRLNALSPDEANTLADLLMAHVLCTQEKEGSPSIGG